MAVHMTVQQMAAHVLRVTLQSMALTTWTQQASLRDEKGEPKAWPPWKGTTAFRADVGTWLRITLLGQCKDEQQRAAVSNMLLDNLLIAFLHVHLGLPRNTVAEYNDISTFTQVQMALRLALQWVERPEQENSHGN